MNKRYNVTEGTDMSIDVCVEIITGLVRQMSTVEIETDSGSATCKLRILFSIGYYTCSYMRP